MFNVKSKLRVPMTVDQITRGEHTAHLKEREYRIMLANSNGFGRAIDTFRVNTGHRGGDELHTITENGFILIQNARTLRWVTILVARPAQIRRYHERLGGRCPSAYDTIIKVALDNQQAGLNNI